MPRQNSRAGEYRQAIREAWLPVVGRQQLKSAEYEHINEWLEQGIALDLILRAIRQCAERARAKRITLNSLGVIRADLMQLQRQQAAMHVGGHKQEAGEEWRTNWDEDLQSLADETSNPELAAVCNELRRDLPQLSRQQAEVRWREIKTYLSGPGMVTHSAAFMQATDNDQHGS
jgi:hypothetical protein